MDLFVYMVLGLAITWIGYVLYLQVATRAAEGRSAEPLTAAFPQLADHGGKALVYCFSPHCGPCKAMSRDVDDLAAQGAPIFKLDIADHPELAREFGIRATPTLILVDGGTIARMVLGAKDADYMSMLIDRAR